MNRIVDSPFVVGAVSEVALWLAEKIGDFAHNRLRPLRDDERGDFGVVLTSTLTLLALVIGFTFSMAVNRYDQRKNYEAAEANAIGTEYVRADFLPSEDGAKIRELLRQYIDQRILFYKTRNEAQLVQIDGETAKLQSALWSSVQTAASAQPTPMSALAVSGMNEVLDSAGRTQAAWWDRIPTEAWALMVAIAISSSLQLGYQARRAGALLILISALTVSIAFFLISDIDSPREGVIRTLPQNLINLSGSVHSP
jgi:hypothetical protein